MRIENLNGEVTLFSEELDLKWATDRTLYARNHLKGDLQFNQVRTKYPEGRMPYGYFADEKAVYLKNLRDKILLKMRHEGEKE